MSFAQKILVPFFFLTIALSQTAYDAARVRIREKPSTPPVWLIKGFDIGLHSAVATFLWIDTRTHLPFLRQGYEKFDSDLALINTLDPKFSTPYAFTVLVLPITKPYPNPIERAMEVGKLGLAKGDPDWRIPFYLATTNFLYTKDRKDAAHYFDIAARTPGIPDIVRRYAINYGLFPNIREQTKQMWVAIYGSTKDDVIKERAKMYIRHFEIAEYLEAAVSKYIEEFHKAPLDISDLAKSGIVPEVPKSPFGFDYMLYGETVGIRPEKTTAE